MPRIQAARADGVWVRLIYYFTRRRYRPTRAVANMISPENLHWSVPDGAVAGVAGVSGAGKSTLLRLVTGRLVPSSGLLERPPKSSTV